MPFKHFGKCIQIRISDGFFVPPPQCFIFDMEGNNNLIAVGLVAKEKQYNYSGFSYIPDGNMCAFGADFGNYTEVSGEYELPHILIQLGKDRYSLLESNAKFHVEKGYVKQQNHETENWWNGNILCGWGDQWKIGAEVANSQSFAWDNEAIKKNADNTPEKSVLITSQHVHPYFDECMDMMRIGDYWCSSNRPLSNINTRTGILKATLPNMLIDMDAAGGGKKEMHLFITEEVHKSALCLYTEPVFMINYSVRMTGKRLLKFSEKIRKSRDFYNI